MKRRMLNKWFNASALFGCMILLLVSCKQNQEPIEVKSPDGKNTFVLFPKVEGNNEEGVLFSVVRNGTNVIEPSTLNVISDDLDFSGNLEVVGVDIRSVNNEWETRFGERSIIPDVYNELAIGLKSSKAQFTIFCRAYDEGVAFAYEIPKQQGIKEVSIDDELISYRFKADHPVWSTPKREPGKLTAQGEYKKIPLSQLPEGAERPLVLEMREDLVVALAEARLVDYARLSLKADPDKDLAILSSLDGKLVQSVQDTITGALKSKRSNEAKIKMSLPLKSPWRAVMMADNYGQLLEQNYLIQNLNPPSEIKDDSWILTGKALREGTLTTEGGYAAIDFVASHNMQYVHFDAGWYGNEMLNESDATTVTLDPKRSKGPFDIEAITAYAKSKGVKVMLYVNRRSLEKQLDDLLPLFQKWGIAGIKFGFVQVGDQEVTAWLHEAVKKAAKYEMIVDIHDEYRPTGFSRTYPNLLTQEGIAGDETTVTNEHTLITMFTRMVAGAADNTVCYYNKRVSKMGSHASQLAKTVCLYSPLQFLYWYDRPSASPEKMDALWGDTKFIGNEPELEFFNAVPTTWDETRVLKAEIGELGIIARRKGNDWYVGGINGVTVRSVTIDFSFLPSGKKYAAKLYTDDESVNTRTKVKIEEIGIDNQTKLTLDIKAKNGFAMQLIQSNN